MCRMCTYQGNPGTHFRSPKTKLKTAVERKGALLVKKGKKRPTSQSHPMLLRIRVELTWTQSPREGRQRLNFRDLAKAFNPDKGMFKAQFRPEAHRSGPTPFLTYAKCLFFRIRRRDPHAYSVAKQLGTTSRIPPIRLTKDEIVFPGRTRMPDWGCFHSILTSWDQDRDRPHIYLRADSVPFHCLGGSRGEWKRKK